MTTKPMSNSTNELVSLAGRLDRLEQEILMLGDAHEIANLQAHAFPISRPTSTKRSSNSSRVASRSRSKWTTWADSFLGGGKVTPSSRGTCSRSIR